MAKRKVRVRQPVDETPLIGPPAADGTPAGRAAGGSVVPTVVGPVDPSVAASIQDVGKALVGAIDDAHGAVGQTAADARDQLTRAVKSAERQVTAAIKDADSQLSEVSQSLANAGVPVSYSAAERAAELDQPSGEAIIDRVRQAALATADPVTSPPPPPPPPSSRNQCRNDRPTDIPAGFELVDATYVWTGSRWDLVSPSGRHFITSGGAPDNPGTVVGESCGTWILADGVQESEVACGPWTIILMPDQPAAVVLPADPGPPNPLGTRNLTWFDRATNKTWTVGLNTIPPDLPAGATWGPAGVTPEGSTYLTRTAPCPTDTPSPPPPPPPPPPAPPDDPSCPAACPAPVIQCPSPPIVIQQPAPVPQPSPPVIVNIPPAPPPPPPPKPAEVGPVGIGAGLPPVGPINWNTAEACKAAAESYTLNGQVTESPATATWRRWLEATGDAARDVAMLIPGVGVDLLPGLRWLQNKVSPLGEIVTAQVVGGSLWDSLRPFIPGISDTVPATVLSHAVQLGAVATVEEKTGIPASYLFQSNRYTMQYLSPQYLPTQSEIDGLFLGNRIDGQLWECWTKANGNLPFPASLVRNAKGNIPNIGEVVALARRGVITLDTEYPARMRQLGVLDPGHAAEWYRLSEYVPPFSDIIRMMIRDVADEDVVSKYRYDKDFDRKFAGPLRKWATDQGIPFDAARALWRAHWDTPSNTALYDMMHRLRPDRPAVQDWERRRVGNEDDQDWNAANPKPPVVTRDDARYLLEVNDMSPGWVEPLLDISYRPITNTDARRAYEIGTIGDAELRNRFLDNGYAPDDADALVGFERAQRNRRISNLTGTMSPRKVLTAYREGLIDEVEADRQLAPAFPDRNVRIAAITRASFERTVETRRIAVRAAVKRFNYGEIDAAGLVLILGNLGIVGLEQLTIMERADATRGGHLKEVRIQYLIDMYQRGLITRVQAADRMERLGYSAEDIARMIELAGAIETERQAGRAARAADKARREARQQRLDAQHELDRNERRLRQLIADREKQLKELEDRIGACGGTVPPDDGGQPTPPG